MVRDLSLRGAFENVRRADSQACELAKVKVLPRNAAAALQGAQNLHLPCHDVLPVAHTLPHLRVRLQPAVVHLRLQPEHALAERPHVLRPGLEKVVNLLHGVQDVTRKVLKALACVRLGLFDDLGLVLRGHEAVLAVRRALPQLIGDGDHGVHRRLQPLVRHRPRRSRGWWDNRGSAPRLSDPPRVLAQNSLRNHRLPKNGKFPTNISGNISGRFPKNPPPPAPVLSLGQATTRSPSKNGASLRA